MYVKCASCGEWMDVKPGHINNISHGICPACFEAAMGKIEQNHAVAPPPGEPDPFTAAKPPPPPDSDTPSRF